MDENRPTYSMHAPSAEASTTSMRLPGHRERFPRVDDHLVEPEVTRDEIVGGRKMEASPAKAPHAGQHGQLDLVVGSHIAPGYRLMVDLLTRHDVDSDFASDSAVVKEGIDPATGTRYLEEIAFEVVSEQNEQIVQAKTPGMIRRGVRRVFAIFVKRGAVEEWSVTKGRFVPLGPEALIEDPCFQRPVEISTLLDWGKARDAVAASVVESDHPLMLAARAEERAGERAESILDVLESRKLEVTDSQRQQILSCRDLPTLKRWFARALVASSAADIFEGS